MRLELAAAVGARAVAALYSERDSD